MSVRALGWSSPLPNKKPPSAHNQSSHATMLLGEVISSEVHGTAFPNCWNTCLINNYYCNVIPAFLGVTLGSSGLALRQYDDLCRELQSS